MTPKQRELVQSSFEQVKPIAEVAAKLFYGRLFDLDPSLELLFKGDLQEQWRKLIQLTEVAVKGLNDDDQMLSAMQSLIACHTAYGAKSCHYKTVGAALLWTLEHGLGTSFTPEVKDAWRALYDWLADTMKAHAQETLDTSPLPVLVATHTGGYSTLMFT